jgi:hypothetical protein
MTNETASTNDEGGAGRAFVIAVSSFIRHSCFVIRHLRIMGRKP